LSQDVCVPVSLGFRTASILACSGLHWPLKKERKKEGKKERKKETNFLQPLQAMAALPAIHSKFFPLSSYRLRMQILLMSIKNQQA
jgi:hypothetical protein